MEASSGAATGGRRVVLVTGASRGIGAAVAAQLVERGSLVAGTHVSAPGASKLLEEEFPGCAMSVRYELGSAASAEGAVAAVVDRWGRLDAVVASAGVWAGGRLERLEDAEWSRVVSANLVGMAQLCRAALPELTRSAAPSITIISSVVGLIGGAGDTAYASAKAGLVGFGRSLAKEVARDGIRVNVLAPGFVETDMTAEVPDVSRRKIARSILLRRFGAVDEVATAAIFLSEEATYCTGSVLTVDGGWSI